MFSQWNRNRRLWLMYERGGWPFEQNVGRNGFCDSEHAVDWRCYACVRWLVLNTNKPCMCDSDWTIAKRIYVWQCPRLAFLSYEACRNWGLRFQSQYVPRTALKAKACLVSNKLEGNKLWRKGDRYFIIFSWYRKTWPTFWKRFFFKVCLRPMLAIIKYY